MSNRYNPISRVSSGRNIEQCLRPGTALRPNGLSLGTSSQRFGTLHSNTISSPMITADTVNIGVEGPYSLVSNVFQQPSTEQASRLMYSTTGKVANVNNTPVTFSTNTPGEAGIFAIYDAAYTAVCVGQYCHTATPNIYISGGSPALNVTISGSNLQVAFASATTAKTLVWKKLKFNSPV